MIIILSALDDAHVAYVLPILQARGADVLWFDPKQCPSTCQIVLDLNRSGFYRKLLCFQDRTIDLDKVTAVWLRRPNPVEADPSVHDPVLRNWIYETASAGLDGTLELLDCLWLPAKRSVLRAAGNKIQQLDVAARIGFAVPRTCMTNSPETFLKFYTETEGRLIGKQAGDAIAYVNGEPLPTYTTVVHRRHALNAGAVSLTPTIFQEYVPKRLELRITVVGDRIFPVAIDSQNSRASRHDWRHYDLANTPYAPHPLPGDVEEKCFRLLHYYGLTYGAIDMILTPDDEYVFLEINPNGQWGWVADMTGEPIAEAIAELLLQGKGGIKK